jgi:hypothetical protein
MILQAFGWFSAERQLQSVGRLPDPEFPKDRIHAQQQWRRANSSVETEAVHLLDRVKSSVRVFYFFDTAAI